MKIEPQRHEEYEDSQRNFDLFLQQNFEEKNVVKTNVFTVEVSVRLNVQLFTKRTRVRRNRRYIGVAKAGNIKLYF